MTALIKRWSSEMSTFHLPTREMTMTLEDVWHILRLPIARRLVSKVVSRGEELDYTVLVIFGRDDLPIQKGQLNLDRCLSLGVPPLPLYMCGLISGILLLD